MISTYLSFFPVAVGMVKGLRSPETIQLDLMHTYNASPAQTFWKLRWPSSMPYLFTSMKVAVAISLVGAIVGELPTGAVAGLGARLLAGSYYGQTVQIWSALFAAAAIAAVLVMAVGIAQRLVLRRMGRRGMRIGFIIAAFAFWLAAWAVNEWLVRQNPSNPLLRRLFRLAVPVLFGVTILVLWEGIVRGFNVPFVLLPPPSAIWARIVSSLPTLWADFRQTFLKAVLIGYALGCGSGFLAAIADRPLALPAARPAADRQFRLGAADHRRRADHGHVVRLRLAVQGGGGRHHDLLPDAGEHGRRACSGESTWSAT